ncbi:10278_t:CDS:10 [Ambispora gerdemannii]|uniref:phenylalanine--tRNA ligase n=1 Tax=Ambispora gerdemannii TaxID=144530 RepID=A0A9N8YRS9_9GLOM|nr:10278_t:CDS:10 [Ambispora gerdemannii]
MPTVNVDKEDLYSTLGKQYTTEEFRELCFEFGIELEEDTSENKVDSVVSEAGGISERALLKIDIPANRYDLLCQEGISRALLIFQEKVKPPDFRVQKPANGIMEKIIIEPETAQIRPHVVGAVLRNIHFTEKSYNNFIDLQDKLHNNLCRKRTLVAIGTHDLDTIKGPFTYKALTPKEIRFKPLNQSKTDKHLGKFLHIIRDSPIYPVIFDSNRIVCSLPPIINGEHSKITLNTKNVFIECTATDLTKAKIVLNTVVTMFSEYCKEKFTVEPVQVIYPDENSHIYPDLEPRTMNAKIDYINSCIGLNLAPAQIVSLLNRMSLGAKISTIHDNQIEVEIPPTRADILHPCDIMEDVAIAYGFNNIPKTFPTSATVGKAFPINKLSDLVRRELASAGWTEVLPLILCSHEENFAYLGKEDDGTTAIKLANPKTAEYQVVRTSLLPGVLKTLRENKKHALPIKLFEVSDVVFKDDSLERRARNERKVCAIYSNKTSGFEVIHGLLNYLLEMLHVNLVSPSEDESGYFIKESSNPTFFPKRSADIFLRTVSSSSNTTTTKIGSFGIIHPNVLENYELFVADGVFFAELNEFFTRELAEEGYSGVEVRVTPARTELIIRATHTQEVLGERGRRIRELTALIQKRFKFPENTVELYAEKVQNRGLCAIAQCESLRYKLLAGLAVRRACYGVLRFIMESGAKGCEVVVSGKLRAARAKSMKFVDGFMIHSGQPIREYVDTSVRHVMLRQGVLGIKEWDPSGKVGPKNPIPDLVTVMDPKEEHPITQPTSEDFQGLPQDIPVAPTSPVPKEFTPQTDWAPVPQPQDLAQQQTSDGWGD